MAVLNAEYPTSVPRSRTFFLEHLSTMPFFLFCKLKKIRMWSVKQTVLSLTRNKLKGCISQFQTLLNPAPFRCNILYVMRELVVVLGFNVPPIVKDIRRGGLGFKVSSERLENILGSNPLPLNYMGNSFTATLRRLLSAQTWCCFFTGAT